MGDPRLPRKKYETPSHPWQGDRIKREREMLYKYGLKNKTEIWKTETLLRKVRGQARQLLAREGEEISERDKEKMLRRLATLGMLPENSTLDDVLALNIETILGRRLQTLVYLHGLAKTPKQARQLIIHGHIAINGRKVRVPSYLVKRFEEENITYSYSSPLNDELHPMRPKIEERELFERSEEEKETYRRKGGRGRRPPATRVKREKKEAVEKKEKPVEEKETKKEDTEREKEAVEKKEGE
ncbi:MAG: 30S ribosomal protein S4 [Thermoplasmata archaeon]|nr:MAG: 30S ribosomal protein S4 [Thermoplasmata archaeon]RLF59830.1 MAG: 30S ribosomal protein S4 [Thermoplasmata archaeon]